MNSKANTMGTNLGEAPMETSGKGLHIGLWVAQVLVALGFGMAGAMKTFTPVADLAAQMAWVADSSWILVRFIGVAEVAGALGLILPSATRIVPILSPIAAVCFVVVSVLGAATHVLYGDIPGMMPILILGGLSAFIAVGRFSKRKILAR